MKNNTKKKLQVLHVIHSFGAGGAELWLLNAVKNLSISNSDMQFDFLVTSGIPYLFDEEIKKHGAHIYYIKFSFKNLWGFRSEFRKLLQNTKYDVIHDHQDFVSGWHFFLGLGQLPPVRISHLHNSYNFVTNYLSNPMRWLTYNIGKLLMFMITDKITGTSRYVMDSYGYNSWPYTVKRVNPVYCGINIEKFAFNINSRESFFQEFNWNSKVDKIAVFVGRLENSVYDNISNEKNPDFALEVACLLVSKNPDWKFLFVGQKGSFSNFIEQQVKQKSLEDKIKILGVRNDIGSILSSCDILVFPSISEGLGMVAVEAQTSGLPVILSDSIPNEVVICNELIHFKNLKEGSIEWVSAIEHISTTNITKRSSYAEIVRQSRFSIQNSLIALSHLYLTPLKQSQNKWQSA